MGQISSGERGELVTFVGIINALGNTIPPVYVVPRLREPKQYIITNAQSLSLVLGNKTGLMTKELFMDVLKHIIKHTNCSTENRILLLLDNHRSHTSYEAIKLCKDSGISVLSFPPHSSHRMQPLDIGVFGPFKTAAAIAFNDWLLSHPGDIITIRQIGELTHKAYIRSFTMSNIISSFQKPGIWPVNRLAFSEDDFAPSSINISNSKERCTAFEKTKENDSHTHNHTKEDKTQEACSVIDERIIIHSNVVVKPSTSKKDKATLSTERKSFEDIRPYPKSKPKETKRKNNSSGSKIYTSTPELDELSKIQAENIRKISLKLTAVKRKNNKPPVKRSIMKQEDTSDSDEEVGSIHLNDTDDSVEMSYEDFPLLKSGELVKQDDFIIVKFATKSTVVYYVGQVLSVSGNNIEVKFMRRKNNSNTFVFPITEDISVIERDDILSVLPRARNPGTARTANLFTFNFNLNGWNIR